MSLTSSPREDLSKDDLKLALKNIDTNQYDLHTGNCGVFALALKRYLGGGELTGEWFNHESDQPTHVYLKWKGVYWDSDNWYHEAELDDHRPVKEDIAYELNAHGEDLLHYVFLIGYYLDEEQELVGDNYREIKKIHPRGFQDNNLYWVKDDEQVHYVLAEDKDEMSDRLENNHPQIVTTEIKF